MQSASRPVLIKRVPKIFDREHAIRFHRKTQSLLNSDRPQIVFDMSKTGYMDSRGADVLLRCLREAMKCDGDVKLAGVTPFVSILLELTRIERLFEVYESPTSAAKSFSGFVPNAGFYPHSKDKAIMRMTQTAVADDEANEAGIAA
jgi:anti-sigma B factor antagonist